MFTLLADAMYTATLAKRGNDIPEHPKDYADRHVPKQARRRFQARQDHNPYRDLW